MNEQLPLFAVPEPPKRIRLGANQQAVLERVRRFGNVRVREAGRIVYIRRGWQDPSRVGADWLDRAGLRVLLSLRRLGLLRYSRTDGRWILTAAGRSNDLIGPERSEGPPLARSAREKRTNRVHAGHSPANRGKIRCLAHSISASAAQARGAVSGGEAR